jgi:hypothetical protein
MAQGVTWSFEIPILSHLGVELVFASHLLGEKPVFIPPLRVLRVRFEKAFAIAAGYVIDGGFATGENAFFTGFTAPLGEPRRGPKKKNRKEESQQRKTGLHEKGSY